MKDKLQKPDSDLQGAEMLKLIQELKEQRNELESQNKVLQIEKQSLSNILEGTHQDITDCKLAEENSRLSKTTYRGILNSITELIYIQDENGCFLDVNEATEKTYGYNRESFIGKTPEFLSAPGKNDLDKITKVIQLAWKGIAQSFEFWGITRDGRIFPKEVNLSLGTFFGKSAIIAVARDISERKQAEETLLKNEAKYRNLVKNMPDGIYKSTEEGKFIDVNLALVKMLGYANQEELMSINILTQLYFEPSDRDSIVLRENNKELGIFRMKKKDGSEIWVEDHGWLNYDETTNVLFHEGILRDITERVQVENMLLESKQQLQLIYDTVNDVLFQIEVQNETDFIFISMNESGLNTIGITLEQIRNKNVKQIIPQPSLDLVLGKYHEAIRTRRTVRWEEETEYPTGVKTAIVTVSPIFNENGKCIRLTGSLYDITERKKAEEILLKSEENLSITLNSIGDGVISTDKNGLIVRMNPIAENLCGWKLSDAAGKPLADVFRIINAETRETVDDPVKKVLKSGGIVGLANHTVLISKNGTECQISDSAAPIKTKEGDINGVVLVFSDITDSYVAQKQIKESENYLRETQIIARLGAYTLDIATGIWSSSEILDEIFGIEKNYDKSVQGWISIIHPEWQETMNNFFIQEVIGNKIPFNKEYQIIRKSDNEMRWVHGIGKLECDDKSNPLRMLGTIQDITERKQTENALKESEERYRAIVEWSPEAIIVHQDWITLYANPAAIKLLKANNIHDLLGKSSFDLIHPDSRAMIMERSKIQIKIGDFTPMTETKLLRIDGTPIDAETQSILVNYNGSPAVQVSIHDITSRKEAEDLIIKAKEQAEESDRLKSAFLANMSHEIRTPMNGIMGFTSLLKETNLTVENQQEYIKIIDQSGTRLLNIINDIIDISKIESNQMMVSISETNVNEKIKFIYDFFKPEASSKGIYLNFKNGLAEKEAFITTDGEKIYAVLTNLVKNAIKFCDNGIIDFGYELKTDCKNPELEFYVKDSGVGIPNGRQHAVFDRFIQADISDKRAFQGAGLGLSISKAYVEMLGGKIWVESEVGVGSSFYFTIPYNAIQKTETAPIKTLQEKESENQVKNLKILIVEDDAISKLLIMKAVTKFSSEILTVSTGIKAVEACRNNPDIDLIMMDINMPVMNGYEATKEIRQFNKKVIIIAQTANAFAGDKNNAIAAGCNDYISKPINRDLLNKTVQKYFE